MDFFPTISYLKKNKPSCRLERQNGSNNLHTDTMPIAPLKIPCLTEKDKLRFWKLVDKTEYCWNWNSCTKNGYGRFCLSGKDYPSHRVSWTIENGNIPESLCVLHKCDNPSCVNPIHLFLGSHKDNMMDMENKGRGNHPHGDNHPARKNPHYLKRGESNPKSKLNEEKVRRIRTLRESGIGYREIATEYGVTKAAVRFIVQRKSWKHIP